MLAEIDLRQRITRTVEYVDDLLALDDLDSTLRVVCQAVHDSLTTPAKGSST
jgi:hypothetical protein